MARFHPNEFIIKYSNLLLALSVVCLLSMIIMPVPPWLLDLLMVLNLSLGMVSILVARTIPDTFKFAFFPTILLITILFRMALNVSSTRLILIEANAGEVIEAFSQLANFGAAVSTSDNYVLGGFLLLIITLVNFLVMAKGANRVLGLAAHFAPDALPGKQAGIDAALWAGTITREDAQERRSTLQREALMYGAFAVTMKFVKGDAFAVVWLTMINMIGGLILGVIQRNMELADATHRYFILSLGVTVVSMVPAIIIFCFTTLFAPRSRPL